MTSDTIKNLFDEHQKVLKESCDLLTPQILLASEIICNTLEKKSSIFWCGNGGSASDAQHLAAEFIGRFSINRIALNSICLNTDTSVLTCIANDFGFDNIFSRQLEGIAKENDLLICLSTSGNSSNIFNAIKYAKDHGIQIITLLGKDGGKCINMSDCEIVVPSNNTARIQEIHITIGHILCYIVEKKLNFLK